MIKKNLVTSYSKIVKNFVNKNPKFIGGQKETKLKPY